ncbi:MAG: type IX secretion system membrane protein PorP/SprF [Saprospiraceae bacterium]|nr:type IX secretion system membrane protein PorP/SprF [Saprospiraceae bacterium]
MKRLTLILLFISTLAFGQEAIFNVGKHNIHLLNYAHNKNDRLNLSLDNNIEFYNKNEQFNTSNLNFNIRVFPALKTGLNIKYNLLGEENNISEFDAIIKYKTYLNGYLNLVVAANFGIIENKISYNTLKPRYSFEEIEPLNQSFKKSNFNLGFGTSLKHPIYEIGVAVNHLNQPKLPLDNERIPIKYTAYIRNNLLREKLFSTLIYQYQDEYFYNPIDMEYYYSMLNYMGVNLDYELPEINFGLGFKYLSNNNNVYSLIIGKSFSNSFNNSFSLNYSASIIPDIINNDFAQFHQLGLYYSFVSRELLRNSGMRIYRQLY